MDTVRGILFPLKSCRISLNKTNQIDTISFKNESNEQLDYL